MLKRLNLNIVIYTLLFTLLCFIEQVNSVWYYSENYVYSARLALCCILLLLPCIPGITDAWKGQAGTAKGWKVYHGIITLVSLLFTIVLWRWCKEIVFPHGQISVITYVLFCGFAWLCFMIVPGTVVSFIKDKKYLRMNRLLLILLFCMILGIVVSRDHVAGKIWVTVSFLITALRPMSKEQQGEMFEGLTNGVIIGPGMMQVCACLLRAFDDGYGYTGAFSNQNMYAMMYCAMLVAVVVKIVRNRGNKRIGLKNIVLFVLYGCVTVLIFMSGSRCGMISLVLVSFYMVLTELPASKKLKAFLGRTGIALLAFIIMCPVVFALIRYTPAVVGEYVHFYGENSQEKVNEQDKWNSEKFVEFDEAMDIIIGRLIKKTLGIENYLDNTLAEPASETASGAVAESISEAEADVSQEEHKIGLEDLGKKKEPRLQYWLATIRNLNIFGHENMTVQVDEDTVAYHAHNIFLQYGYSYGIVPMLLFVALYAVSLLRCLKFRKWDEKATSDQIVLAPFLLAVLGVGMFEYMFLFEKVLHIVIYISLLPILWNGKEYVKRKEK